MSDQVDSLSEREVEILRLVATGASNKEIAGTLVISPNTVKVHLRNIFAKLGVVSRTEATLYAIRTGLVSQPSLAPETVSPPLIVGDDDDDEISKTSPIAFSTAIGSAVPERARSKGFRSWLTLGGLILLLLIAAGSVYAYFGRAQPALSTPVPTPANQANSNAIPPRWSQDAHLPRPVSGMGMSLYDGKYYLIGGSDGQTALNKVYRYNPADQSWEVLADKPTSTSQIRAALIGERIYVPGGRTANGKPSSILEVFDPRHNTWESKQPLPIPLSDYALASFDGKLYLFGGFDGSAYSAQVFIYNPDTDTWKKGSPLPSGRSLPTADSIEGKILVCGGFDGKSALNQVLIYFPNRDSNGETAWEAGPDLPQARYGMNSTSLANMVFLFGGQGSAALGSQNGLAGLMLDADQARWTSIDQAPGSIGEDGSAIASGNFIHIFGGGNQNKPSDQHLVYQAIYTISIPLTQGQ
jgi:DNA-binding CsgD family transcriptional regulator/N-acetylneuraminic acid mutarotase